MAEAVVYDPVDQKPMKPSEAYATSDGLYFASLETQQMYYHLIQSGFEVVVEGGKPMLKQAQPQRIWNDEASLRSTSKDAHFVRSSLDAGTYTFTAEVPDLHSSITGARRAQVKLDVTSGDGREKLATKTFSIDKSNPKVQERFLISVDQSDATMVVNFSSNSVLKAVRVVGYLDYLPVSKSIREMHEARRQSMAVAKSSEYVVELTKGTTGVGMTLSWDHRIKSVLIRSIEENGAAQRTHKLDVGDRIKGIQGQRVDNLSFKQVIKLLRDVPTTVVLLMEKAPKGFEMEDRKPGRKRPTTPPRPGGAKSMTAPPPPSRSSTSVPAGPTRAPPGRGASQTKLAPPLPVVPPPAPSQAPPTRGSAPPPPPAPAVRRSPPTPPAPPTPPTRSDSGRGAPPPIPSHAPAPPVPASGGNDAGFEKYSKMLKMGLPEGAVRNKAAQDGVVLPDSFFAGQGDAATGAGAPAPPPAAPRRGMPPPPPPGPGAAAPPTAAGAAPPPPAPGASLPPGYEKYERMQKAGLPEGAILQAMSRDGVTPPPGFGGGAAPPPAPAAPSSGGGGGGPGGLLGQIQARPQLKKAAPPPPSSSPAAAGGGGGGNPLLAAIQGGVHLKKAEPVERAPAAPTNPLLAALQNAKKDNLKHVDTEKLQEERRRSAANSGNPMSAIAQALDARRDQIVGGDSDAESDEEWSDNDEWAL
ncbi:FERM and PDZ domain-containing protein 2 [Hondaea fermentalgiana]|uniref:FERM and PDZ domain-containing protein 2 n=1 Tax=Hondaea fermentalgiana TaxID=2315210 RepID=A0A2R5G9L5_9STRA|nr:FERM and PDZ domain-containing protein 2 [Hondaea fermentalgiana]|eukprot:GBG27730.1 FERM and PDZ domain-containing protein 2 [Hondaea fermentalgiana]